MKHSDKASLAVGRAFLIMVAKVSQHRRLAAPDIAEARPAPSRKAHKAGSARAARVLALDPAGLGATASQDTSWPGRVSESARKS